MRPVPDRVSDLHLLELSVTNTPESSRFQKLKETKEIPAILADVSSPPRRLLNDSRASLIVEGHHRRLHVDVRVRVAHRTLLEIVLNRELIPEDRCLQ